MKNLFKENIGSHASILTDKEWKLFRIRGLQGDELIVDAQYFSAILPFCSSPRWIKRS
jgi:hypothetical protein